MPRASHVARLETKIFVKLRISDYFSECATTRPATIIVTSQLMDPPPKVRGLKSPSTPGRCFSSQKGPLYGASRESRVGIATLKEPVTQNRRQRNRETIAHDGHTAHPRMCNFHA